MSRILFISSENTGHGHKSITQSLKEQFEQLDPSLEIEIIDGFSLGGKFSYAMSKLYNPVAVNLPLLWKLCYKAGNIVPGLVSFFNTINIKRNLLKYIKKVQPDLIVPVHPAYVKSALDVLKDEKISIPVIPIIADLDNVSNLWADKRCKYILCPTVEAMDSMLRLGIGSDKLKVLGFPAREKFCGYIPDEPDYSEIPKAKKIGFLLMSGSQGTRQISEIARTLLENVSCKVTILAGNNGLLKSELEKSLLPLYGDNVEICGFTQDVDAYMKKNDIMIVRASPNVLTEAINLCKPVIITGALTGQEEKNPEFVVKHNLGVFCKNVDKLPEIIKQLLSNDGKQLKEIYKSQINFRQPDSARKIAEFLINATEQIKGIS